MIIFFNRRIVVALAAFILLSACAAQNGHRALANGNLKLAEVQATQAMRRGDSSGYNNMGAVEMRRGNRDLAIYWYNIAARMGDPTARMNLAQLGAEIPPIDLVAQHSVVVAPAVAQGDDSSELIAAGVTGYEQGRYGTPAVKPYRTVLTPAPSIRPQPAPMLLPPAPQCENQTITEKGKVRYVQVCK